MSFKPMETERLIIRKFRPDDFTELYEYLSDSNVVKYEPYEPYTLEQTKREAEFRSHSDEYFAVTLKDGGRLIGNLYLGRREFNACELGFVFDRRWQMCGYATESAAALLHYAFGTLKVHRVFAMCNPLNYRSYKLMERLGMRREALFRKNVFFRKDSSGLPVWQDTLQYAILSEEWRGREGAALQ